MRKFLSALVHRRRVPSSLLLFGKEGVGKKDLAFEFASALLCLKESYPPCGECTSCKHMKNFLSKKKEELLFYGEDKTGKSTFLFLRGDHPDFVYLTPEKSEIKIDQIRGAKDFVYLAPALSKRKVVLVEPADSMNPYAQNALLKVLEEPPLHTHFLLVTAHLQKILPTIRSRSFLLEVPPLTPQEIKELTGVDDPLILELSEGSLKMALKLKEDTELLKTAQAIAEGDILTLYRKALEVEKWDMERQLYLLKLLQAKLHRRFLQKRNSSDKQALDRISAGLEYLSRGIKLSLLLFQLAGGEKHALHKGKVSRQQGLSS
ncbi:MAG: DNA polymerase III subunit delta' [Aquificaceae bacterium]|nr:DNA polymerase III subunit delta' [Aquificaceae bacterium]MCX8060417.1 DNA polymerase III subunit delta' [Aquificaceae bacterium]